MKRDILTDAVLPHLRTVVDTEEMARLFESHFAADYPEHGFRVEGSSIEKVYYRIGKHCGVLHRLRLRDLHGFFDARSCGSCHGRMGRGRTAMRSLADRAYRAPGDPR